MFYAQYMIRSTLNRNLRDDPNRLHNACILGVKMSKMASTEDVVSDVALEMGYTSLCDKQEAILGFMRGRGVLVSLPTGSGKNLCYSILPKVFNRVKKEAEIQQYCNCCKSIDIFDERSSMLTRNQRNN